MSERGDILSEEDPLNWLDSDQTMRKDIIRPGEGLRCPRDNSECHIIIEKIAGPKLDGIRLDFLIGVPCKVVIGDCDSAIGRHLQKILLIMKNKELSVLVMRIREIELYEGSDNCLYDKSKTVEIRFQVEMLEFEPKPEIYELSDDVKIESASKHKLRGIELFKLGLLYSAFYRFSKAIKLCIFVKEQDEERNSEIKGLMVSCHLNIAACQLKTERFDLVVKNCKKVLKLDRDNVKGYYRRGIAYLNLSEYEKAKKDFDSVLELEPNNREALKQMKILKEKERRLDLFYAQRMQKMFK